DEPTGSFGRAPDHWRQLDWAALAADEAGLAGLTHAPVRGVPFVVPPAQTLERPVGPDPGSPLLAWPRNSAHLAHITLQPAVEVAVHAGDMLPEALASPVRVTGVSPAVGRQGEVVDVTVTGVALADVVAADFGPGIRVDVLSATATTAGLRLAIGALAPVGTRAFRLATPDWAADSGAAGVTFTVTPQYSGLMAAPRTAYAAGPPRVEVVEPADDVLDAPPRSVLVSFSKEVRWETLTERTFLVHDDAGRSLGVAEVEPYPFAPGPRTVSRATLAFRSLDPAVASGPRPLTLTVRLVGTGPDPILDLEGQPLDGRGTGGPGDFVHRLTVVGEPPPDPEALDG
ncbi:MAG TPA: hypothetical protein VFO65_09875, partial [Acidimicrobiales bacterium]|nr:hypothetical protein [Acidimicrobiales bacterium]